MNQFLSRIVSALQMLVIIAALGGEALVTQLGMQLPAEQLEWLKKNKFALILGAWFIGNMVNNGLTNTGAFEVFYNGHKVFSKLETGRAPMVRQVVDTVSEMMGQ